MTTAIAIAGGILITGLPLASLLLTTTKRMQKWK